MSEQFLTDRLYCTADTHVLASYPSQNFHSADYTNIGAAGGQQAVGLFAFNTSHNLPSNARVVWARMYFYIDYASDSNVYTFTVRPCSAAWTETGVTYNTLPTTTGTEDTVSIGNSTQYVDVTNTFNAWRGGAYSMANGLYITCSTASSRKRLMSRTASAADNRPYLQICYTFPTGTPSTDSGEYALGSTVNVTVAPAQSDDTHTLTYKIGSTILATHTNISTTDSYATDISLANYITSATSGTLTVVCETFRDGVSQGTETTTATLNIPSSVVPTISSVTVVEGADSFPSELSGIFVQGKSKFLVTIAAAGAYGSTVSSYSTVASMGTYSGSSFTSDFVTQSGSNSLVVTVTDSRGRTATYTQTVSVVAYSAPAISKFSIARCLEGGTLDRSGTYASAAITASASAVSNANAFSVYVQYRAVGASSWTSSDNISPTNYTVDTSGTVLQKNSAKISTFDDLTGYEFRLVVADSFSTIYATDTMPTKTIVLDITSTGNGIGLGTEAAANTLTLNSNWTISGGETCASGIQGSWANATLSSGVTTPDETLVDGALRYRRMGNAVYLAGGIQATPSTTPFVVATIPLSYAPTRGVINWLATSGGLTIARCYINTSGEIYLSWVANITNGSKVTSSTWIAMNFMYFID